MTGQTETLTFSQHVGAMTLCFHTGEEVKSNAACPCSWRFYQNFDFSCAASWNVVFF